MCGLAGRFHPDGLPPDPPWGSRALERLAHRGPDGEGRFADARCELVHTRLALLDLTPTGAQPMASADGTAHVVYNGEIYNHAELRRRLAERGHVFRGTSDTEVLLHLYDERGPGMCEDLRGMFAFAIYDARRARVLLARDRFGIKPLYVAALPQQVLFGSEIKALLAAASLEPRIDRQACYDFLGLSYVPEPATGIAGIQALPRGSFAIADRQGLHTVRFARPSARPDGGAGLEACRDRVAERLTAAVRRQSVADVPVAALLSGGIDSSLVVAALGRAGAAPTATFNARFSDRDYDETPLALAVAERYGTAHRTLDIDTRTVTADLVLDLLRHFDQPFADSSLIPTFLVSRAIREQGLKCALSGDGGDEGFGGYASFWRIHRMATLMKLPRVAREILEHAGAGLRSVTRDVGRQLGKAARLAADGRRDTRLLLAGLASYLTPAEKESLVRPEARAGLDAIPACHPTFDPPGTGDLEELSRRLTDAYFDLGLPCDMLRKVDMMSMRARIEVRVPLLDEDVVDAALSLPHRLKSDGRQGKLVLRALARSWLPPEVASHPKHGFAIPLDRIADRTFLDMAHDLLAGPGSRTRAFLDPSVVGGWLERFRQAVAGRTDGNVSRGGVYQRVLMLLALETFMSHHRLAW